jgi:hypothetical protein
MNTPSVARLALACALLPLALPAFAGSAVPGTSAPHSSGDWGRDEAALRANANGIVAKLIAAAREGVDVDGKKVAYAKLPDFVIDLNNVVIGGSPAAAFSAGVGMNAPGRTIGGVNHSANDLVYTTNALYTMADQDEAAMFIAHEIGHLAYGHAEKLEKEKSKVVEKLYGEWETVNTIPDGEPTNVTVNRFFKDSAGKIQSALNPIQQPLEDDADKYGRALAVKAGFPGGAAVSSFQRAQDWLWALKLDLADPNHAGSVADRAAKNAKWLEEQKAAKERAATALRRSKCAAEGTSCQ